MEDDAMKTALSSVMLALVIGLSTGSCTQTQDLASFDQVDVNHDGTISQNEASVVNGLDFQMADANQDGVLDRDEYGRLSSEG